MNKYFSTIFFLVLTISVPGQNSIDQALVSVSKNNKTITAANQYLHAKGLEYHTGITPENPFISADYMTGKPLSGGNQFDFLAIQSFDFPSVYVQKGNLAEEQVRLLEIGWQELKQDILLETKRICIEAIYFNQYRQVLEYRKAKADTFVANYQKKYDLEQISALDLNKAKLQLLGLKTELRFIESQIQVNTEKLTQLNGGNLLIITDTIYPVEPYVPTFDILKASIEVNDTHLQWLRQQTIVSQSQVKVSKALTFPKIETGYHYQSVLGQSFNGVHFGISIPIWQQKNKVKASEAKAELSNYQVEEYRNEHYFLIRQYYEQYINLKKSLEDYNELLNNLNTEEILKKSLELGEIDFITYVMEIEYYYKAYYNLLLLEKEYQQVVAKLFKYQL